METLAILGLLFLFFGSFADGPSKAARRTSRERLVRPSGAVSRATLDRVEEIVRILLGL